MHSRERFPRLYKAHHWNEDEYLEERMQLFNEAVGKLLGRPPTYGDLFAASLGTTVDDPVFQRAIAASLGEEDQWDDEHPEFAGDEEFYKAVNYTVNYPDVGGADE